VDPNVQVAFLSVVSTLIATVGVIFVAIKNSQKERTKAAEAGVEVGLDEEQVLGRMLELIAENGRKEKTIAELRAKNASLMADNRQLRAQLRQEKKTHD
jgi:hypothetical protein